MSRAKKTVVWLTLIASGAWFGSCAASDYEAGIAEYRSGREERLASTTGWLTLVGLHWLEPGDNPAGADPSLAIVLPENASPPRAGVFTIRDGGVRFVASPGVEVTLGGQPLPDRPLRDDSSGEPDLIELGRLQMHLIRRGDLVGLRVKDPESRTRIGFEGLDYFPVDPSFRVVARLERFPEPETAEIPTAAGTTASMSIPGRLSFEIAGESQTLTPFVSSPDDRQLFIIFRDETSGRESYGAGRYLYATLEGETAVVDFNKAYNPPCAFTRFATCPLPPRSNRLPVAIRAGEMVYSAHGSAGFKN